MQSVTFFWFFLHHCVRIELIFFIVCISYHGHIGLNSRERVRQSFSFIKQLKQWDLHARKSCSGKSRKAHCPFSKSLPYAGIKIVFLNYFCRYTSGNTIIWNVLCYHRIGTNNAMFTFPTITAFVPIHVPSPIVTLLPLSHFTPCFEIAIWGLVYS